MLNVGSIIAATIPYCNAYSVILTEDINPEDVEVQVMFELVKFKVNICRNHRSLSLSFPAHSDQTRVSVRIGRARRPHHWSRRRQHQVLTDLLRQLRLGGARKRPQVEADGVEQGRQIY